MKEYGKEGRDEGRRNRKIDGKDEGRKDDGKKNERKEERCRKERMKAG